MSGLDPLTPATIDMALETFIEAIRLEICSSLKEADA
jgi:hypothetical protein